MSRKPKNIKLKKEIRIYCEGETEKIYFDLLKQRYRLPNVKVKTKGSVGQSLVLVNYTIDSLNKLSKKDRSTVEKVLVVFDKDDDSWDVIDQAMVLAKDNNIQVCFSNECFEVWLLAHFEEISKTKKWSREALYDKLSRELEIDSYDDVKANKTMIQRIFINSDKAQENSFNLSENYKEKNYCDMVKIINDIFISDQM